MGVGRLEELHVVLHAAVGALRLVQAVLEVLQAALVAALRLRGQRAGQCVRCPAQTGPMQPGALLGWPGADGEEDWGVTANG